MKLKSHVAQWRNWGTTVTPTEHHHDDEFDILTIANKEGTSDNIKTVAGGNRGNLHLICREKTESKSSQNVVVGTSASLTQMFRKMKPMH